MPLSFLFSIEGEACNLLRKLVIKFTSDGELFREIDEERNYFLSEAESIVEDIRNRLATEKRMAAPKSFEFWIDGQLAVVSYVSFEKRESLQSQLTHTITSNNSWEEEIRHKYVNLVEAYAEEERQLLVNREFRAFAIRYDQIFGHSACKPCPLYLDIVHLNKLFVAVHPHIETSLYSELEKVIAALQDTFYKAVEDSYEQDCTVEQSMEDNEAFNRFIQYFVACFQSVSKIRIETLCPHFAPYQLLQTLLFKNIAKTHGFSKAYHLHRLLKKALVDKFDSILSQGFALKTDEMVEALVISPVLQAFKEEHHHVFGERVMDDAETREAIADIS